MTSMESSPEFSAIVRGITSRARAKEFIISWVFPEIERAWWRRYLRIIMGSFGNYGKLWGIMEKYGKIRKLKGVNENDTSRFPFRWLLLRPQWCRISWLCGQP